MIRKLLVGSIAALAALGLATSANAAVSIVNGSFESGIANVGNFATLAPGDTTSITGWTVGGAGVDYIQNYWEASDGVRSLDLSALSAGSVSQLLSGLTIGQRYLVTFDLSGNPDGGSALKVGTASASGVQSSTFSFPQSGTRADMNWVTQTFAFTALSTSETLSFASNQLDPFGPALDNVGITAAVPEPATWALMIGGFGAAGAMLRRRRHALA